MRVFWCTFYWKGLTFENHLSVILYRNIPSFNPYSYYIIYSSCVQEEKLLTFIFCVCVITLKNI